MSKVRRVAGKLSWVIGAALLLIPIAYSSVFAEKRGIRVDGQSVQQYVANQSGKAFAVVIGIDAYTHISPLRYAEADGKAVAQMLRQQGYQVTELYNKKATKRAIESELRTKLLRTVGEHDRVLIFFAGHGKDERVKGGKPLGYLLPVDGEQDDVPATGISMGMVRELADALPAKHVLFLLDVCFGGIAGTLTRHAPPTVTEAYIKQITRERGRHLITAGAGDQEVVEAAQWGHSVFTYYLLKGLDEGLADQDDNGVITAVELFTYLQPRVFGEAQQVGQVQTPQMSELSGEKGEFVFFTKTTTDKHRAVSTTPEIGGKSAEEIAVMQQRLEEMERKLADQIKAAEAPKPVEVARARPYEQPRQMPKDIVGKDGAPMALIPEGEFQYGDSNQRMSLPAFYLDRYEVTTSRYSSFMREATQSAPYKWHEVDLGSDGDLPVIGVSWHDAEAYCRHYGKRLPSEKEWEKAARGTDGRHYPWGNQEPSQSLASYDWGGREWKGYGILASVESFDSGKSPYGISHMAGNVWEWTSSDYGRGAKVIRGGSWLTDPKKLRSATRDGVTPPDGSSDLGFRCAQDPF